MSQEFLYYIILKCKEKSFITANVQTRAPRRAALAYWLNASFTL